MDTLRFALRRLSTRPAATLACICTLAGAVGAAVSMWTVLDGLLLHPLRVRDAASLGVVTVARDRSLAEGVSYSVYRDIRERGPLQAMTGWGSESARVTSPAGRDVSAIHFVDARYFDVLGLSPARGRAFAADEDQPGAARAMLAYHFWDRAFARRDDAVGTVIDISGQRVTIVGVAPRGFRGLDLTNVPDLFMPLHAIEDVTPGGNNYLEGARADRYAPTSWIRLAARLPAGTPLADVDGQLNALAAREASGPRFGMVAADIAALPMATRDGVVRFTRLLSITVALILLVGCATVALLLLVRTEDRRIELATCLALGASRARLMGGVALEGALMSIAGSALALPLAKVMLGLLDSFALPGGVALGDLGLAIDSAALAIAGLGAALSTLLVAAVVLLASPGHAIMPALRAHATTERGRPRARAALVIVQVAVAMVLLTGTILFVRSLAAAAAVNPGRDASMFVIADFRLPSPHYTAERRAAFHAEILTRLAGNGAIAAVSPAADMGSMTTSGRLVIDGMPRAFPSRVSFKGVQAGYFDTLRLPLLEGRAIGAADTAGAPPAAVISESLARLLGDGHALSRRVEVPFGPDAAAVEIVGVAADLITVAREQQPLTVYLAAAQHPAVAHTNAVIVRAASSGAAARHEIAAAARAVDPAVEPVLHTLRESLLLQMRPQQMGATVLGALGVVAALLTVVGLFVVSESTAARRTRELGIRAALGATRWDLGRLLLRDNVVLAATGVITGLVVVWLGAGTIRAFLFAIEPLDATTLAAVPMGLIAVAVAVGLGPAIRAGRADLAQVLRRD